MKTAENLIKFINAAPTALHTVAEIKSRLLAEGFTELSEKEDLGYSDGGAHFVIRGGGSIIAFKGGKRAESFMICASHTDTPSLKITGNSERVGSYSTIPVEKYGGSILYSWLDRPLSIAGRAVIKTENGLSVKLVNIDKDLAIIPSIAIHQNRGVNDGYKFNPAVDMLPLLSLGKDGTLLTKLVSDALRVPGEDIISTDLYFYNREEGRVVGADDELILSPRLDNLASVYSSLAAFLSAPESDEIVSVFAAFDNEEVGNSTKQGANSTFLKSILTKISCSETSLLSMLTDSFMVSLDNAHAKHPNHPELANPDAAPILGKGVCVKYHANQFYTTDAVSDAVIRTIAKRADVPLQSFATRADMLSGSTLGSVATTRLGVMSVDLGIPQLAMHSSSESCAVCDVEFAARLIEKLYSSKIVRNGDTITIK